METVNKVKEKFKKMKPEQESINKVKEKFKKKNPEQEPIDRLESGAPDISKYCDSISKRLGLDPKEILLLQSPVERIKKEDSDIVEKTESTEKICPVKIIAKKSNKAKIDITNINSNDDKADIKEDDKIAMSSRKICPVEVKAKKPTEASINVGSKSKQSEDNNLNNLITDLNRIEVQFCNVKRVSTGLVELDIVQKTGNLVRISVDVDSSLYGNGHRVFFLGKVKPIDEYNVQAFLFAPEPIFSIVNGAPIPTNFYVPEGDKVLNRMLDSTTLIEKDSKKREAILSKAAKVIEEMNDDIIKAAAGEPFRFAFAKCKSENMFTLVSSKRNRVSNLSKDKLFTNKEIWIEVNDNQVTLNSK